MFAAPGTRLASRLAGRGAKGRHPGRRRARPPRASPAPGTAALPRPRETRHPEGWEAGWADLRRGPVGSAARQPRGTPRPSTASGRLERGFAISTTSWDNPSSVSIITTVIGDLVGQIRTLTCKGPRISASGRGSGGSPMRSCHRRARTSRRPGPGTASARQACRGGGTHWPWGSEVSDESRVAGGSL